VIYLIFAGAFSKKLFLPSFEFQGAFLRTVLTKWSAVFFFLVALTGFIIAFSFNLATGPTLSEFGCCIVDANYG